MYVLFIHKSSATGLDAPTYTPYAITLIEDPNDSLMNAGIWRGFTRIAERKHLYICRLRIYTHEDLVQPLT